MCKKCNNLLCFGCKKTDPAPPSPAELERLKEQAKKAVEDGDKYMNAWEKVGNKSPFNSNFGR